MIRYSEEARRNARHLLNIANAVLQGKPLQTWAGKRGQSHNGEWKPVEPGGDLLSKVYRSYRVAGAQQLELPKEKEVITTKVTFNSATPEDGLTEARRTAASGSLWINPNSRYIYMLVCEITSYRLIFLGPNDGLGQPETGLLLLDAHQDRPHLLRNLLPFTGSVTLTQQVT